MTLYANTFTFRIADTSSGAIGTPKVVINSNGPNAGSPQTLVMGVDGASFGQTAYLDTEKGGVSAVTPLAFRMNGTEYMRVHTNGNVGIRTTSPDCPLDLGENVQNKIIGLWNPNKNGVNATDFYGFGINAGTLRYQVFGANDTHKFYGSTSLFATLAETTATFNGRVVTPNRYYIMGYLAGGTTGGNYISLGSQQTSGGMAVTSSNKLVAPISGLYHFGFNTIMNTTTGRNDVNINVNGGSIVSTLNEDNGTGYHYRSGMITYYLYANDFVQFYCASGTIYNAFNVDSWHTYFFYHVG
jgi:hypothetical protein